MFLHKKVVLSDMNEPESFLFLQPEAHVEKRAPLTIPFGILFWLLHNYGIPSTDHLIFGGGEGFGKFFLYPNRSEKKNVFNEVKNKKVFLHSVNFFEALFTGKYKGLEITQYLTCVKHVDLLLASIVHVLNVNYKIRKIHRNIYKD